MEVRVCKNCRRLFNYLYGPELCKDCMKFVTEVRLNQDKKTPFSMVKPLIKEEEDKYLQVKDYIMTHPKASVSQIAETNDVSPSKLFEWIRDERLEFSDDSEYAWFECELCGEKIKSGRLCSRCKIGRK